MNTHNQDDIKNKPQVSSVAAAVTGAVVGAGVAVAGAVALKDKKNREKVKEVLTNMKDQAMSYMSDMQKATNEKQEELKEKIITGQKVAKKVTDAAKESVNKTDQKHSR